MKFARLEVHRRCYAGPGGGVVKTKAKAQSKNNNRRQKQKGEGFVARPVELELVPHVLLVCQKSIPKNVG